MPAELPEHHYLTYRTNKDVQKNYMPVVFDSNDRVIGYGYEFYKNTMEQLGSGPY